MPAADRFVLPGNDPPVYGRCSIWTKVFFHTHKSPQEKTMIR